MKMQDSVTTKYKVLRFAVEMRVSFVNKELARLVVEVITVTQEREASVAMIEQLSFVRAILGYRKRRWKQTWAGVGCWDCHAP